VKFYQSIQSQRHMHTALNPKTQKRKTYALMRAHAHPNTHTGTHMCMHINTNGSSTYHSVLHSLVPSLVCSSRHCRHVVPVLLYEWDYILHTIIERIYILTTSGKILSTLMKVH
jgi:hypothetical protein